MSKDVEISPEFTVHSDVSATMDMGLDDIRITQVAPLSSTVDLGLDNLRIKELPRIDVGVEMSTKPTRVHLPVNYKVGFSAFGIELVALSVCGEGMVIVEDYVPHRSEACA